MGWIVARAISLVVKVKSDLCPSSALFVIYAFPSSLCSPRYFCWVMHLAGAPLNLPILWSFLFVHVALYGGATTYRRITVSERVVVGLAGGIQGEDSRRTMVGTSAFAAAVAAVGAQFVYCMALVRAGGFAVESR